MDDGESEEDEHLPDHTVSMRRALSYCQDVCEQLRADNENKGNRTPTTISHRRISSEQHCKSLVADAKAAALSVPETRRDSLCKFWEKRQQQNLLELSNAVTEETVFDVIDKSSTPLTALEFRNRYQVGNIPCLIRGMDQTPFFSKVCSQWRCTTTKDPVDKNYSSSLGSHDKEFNDTLVNREWFYQNLGKDATVPVRYQPSTSEAVLDEEGRADECETKQMSLQDWTDILDHVQGKSSHSDCSKESNTTSDFYLKDWHLQSTLRRRAADHTHQDLLLYQVPPYFQYDLLNNFLTKFTEHGDYMFTYWGPRGSQTTIHSDVLNSFSWSLNVSGAKKWKFYPPPLKQTSDDKHESSVSTEDPLVIVQYTGECIFVACGWKHEVTNLGTETLSINHNWITTANIDCVWTCLRSEMKAIEAEIEAWGMGNDCWDARESMLKGCVGLDVTAFFFMMLTRFLDLLSEATLVDTTKNSEEDEDDMLWQYCFDLVRLQELLSDLRNHEDLGLEKRLGAVLLSDTMARDAMEISEFSISVAENLIVEVAGNAMSTS